MKVLIIGFGSIGKRHYDVLSKFSQIESIDLITKQQINNIQSFKFLEEVDNINTYDYFVIATQTNKHFEQLKYLEENVENKLIFCEKPLFETKKNLLIKKNKVFIGYVLRFHPLLKKLKTFLEDETVIKVNVDCGQYLPTWRPNINYKDCYSAKKEEGGGVLLDLSHEIDYVQWLFGKITAIKSYQVKISDLEIDSDDLTMLIGKTNKNVFVNVSMDYISKFTHRRILVDTLNGSYELDFIANELLTKNKAGLEEKYDFPNLERNYLFEQMHTSILTHNQNICDYQNGLEVMDTISRIQEQNR
ncbi:Gfo/Idh/MocA family protein [Arcobacter sp.]|uniref:Gfo/Idh/MocA family protein n=1 Tax=unclassified Arcobacter TaxID=2593671 RepID=UPI003B00E357